MVCQYLFAIFATQSDFLLQKNIHKWLKSQKTPQNVNESQEVSVILRKEKPRLLQARQICVYQRINASLSGRVV
jgi:hypothetical protein